MRRPGTVITVYSQHYSTCEGRNLIIFPITWHIVRRIKVIIKNIPSLYMYVLLQVNRVDKYKFIEIPAKYTYIHYSIPNEE